MSVANLISGRAPSAAALLRQQRLALAAEHPAAPLTSPLLPRPKRALASSNSTLRLARVAFFAATLVARWGVYIHTSSMSMSRGTAMQQLLRLLPRAAPSGSGPDLRCERWFAAGAGGMAAIRELRERSGAPITDVKAALEEAAWDLGACAGGRLVLCRRWSPLASSLAQLSAQR